MMRQPLMLSALGLATVANAWTADANCKKISEIYTDGQHLLEKMWGGAFTYETDETKAYTMWWTEGGVTGVADAHNNPNDLITVALGQTVPNTCMNSGFFHKPGPPTPEGPDFTECHPWHANACCHEATVVTPKKMNEAYGVGYEWDRCGPMSQACERFFVEEACMYECEASISAFRKYSNEEKALCKADGVAVGATVTKPSDGSTYTCVADAWKPKNSENSWEIHQMPIKASYADAFYRACANDQFCDSGSFWACEGLYHQHLNTEAELAANKTRDDAAAAEAKTAAAEAAKAKAAADLAAESKLAAELEADLKAEKDKGLEGWAIALIVILLLLGAPPPPALPFRTPAHPPAQPPRPRAMLAPLPC